MTNIAHLASLAGLSLTEEEIEQFGQDFESIIPLLEQVKNFKTSPSNKSWHEILGLQTHPSDSLTPDSSPERLLANVQHPIVGQAIEVAKFVE